ncbi:MAG: ATP-dependent DNA helicase [Clostridiaceae bacterium]|nr:ATP-dependent DNA helicase [Clostridiaceae bacterium]
MNPKDPGTEVIAYSVSARLLAEQIYVTGNLSGVSFSSVSGQEGTRLHRKVFDDIAQRYPDRIVRTEVPLFCEYSKDGFLLRVSGRADCLIEKHESNSDLYSLIEIKSHNRQNATVNDLFRPVHRAQLLLYAHMLFCDKQEIDELEIILSYVSVQTVQPTDKTERITRLDAKIFFDETCRSYRNIAQFIVDERTRRNESITRLSFPYINLRDGQKMLMESVVGAIRKKEILFAEAPTGIGKTIGVLFPALKCIARGFADKIFYLTAKISTRDVCRKTLHDLRNNGLYIRSILLSSKESMCPNKDIYCEPKVCPYAIGYYDRLNAALSDLKLISDITPDEIQKTSAKYSICPFELSLDFSEYCDVIIGDYNHAFHPRIRLERYFEDPSQSHILLNDEAHNLADRSREMFTAKLNFETFDLFYKAVRGITPEIDAHSEIIYRYFSTVYDLILSGEKSINRVESTYKDEHVFIADDFRAVKMIPKFLYAELWRLCYRLSFILDTVPVGPVRKAILDFFFEARFFITIIEQYYGDSYIFVIQIDKRSESGKPFAPTFHFSLSCLDASEFISSRIKKRHPCVFFSATLSPSVYYRTILVGPDEDSVDEIVIESPFPPENLKLIFRTDIRTVYRERVSTVNSVAECIIDHVSKSCGNYIVYFPSFRYLNFVSTLIRDRCSLKNTEILMQNKDMSASDKENFLKSFNVFGTRTLLAFAVLGGHFGEGIDLVGEKLSGVFIVGVGIPQISPEREILRQYYQEKFGDGYAYAYRFPGWEKVLQASGRVIRDESDQGFVVLMDHRYAQGEYRCLFPKHWRTELSIDPEEYIPNHSDDSHIE